VNLGGSRLNLFPQGRNFIVNKKSVFCQRQNGFGQGSRTLNVNPHRGLKNQRVSPMVLAASHGVS
jgi:hypothetical protein